MKSFNLQEEIKTLLLEWSIENYRKFRQETIILSSRSFLIQRNPLWLLEILLADHKSKSQEWRKDFYVTIKRMEKYGNRD